MGVHPLSPRSGQNTPRLLDAPAQNRMPAYSLHPCLTCRNLCTTPDFISQYEIEVERLKAIIKEGGAQGRTAWVDKNQALLERYEAILAVLKEGNTHHQAGKKGREYVGEERAHAGNS